jgi:glycine oxidase
MHDVAETRRLAPFVAPQALGSMECRAAAQVRNPRLLQALEASCRKAGVDIRVGTPVGDLLLEADRVRGVQTDAGDWGAKTVILCAGAWSSQIGSRLRELMPVRPIRGQMILLKLDRRPFTTIVSRGKTYLVPRLDGHVLLGATEEPEAEFLIRNTAQGLAGLIEKGVKLVPSLSDAPIEATWAGLRPGTPDDLPYIGTVPTMPGLIAATGHFRSGLGLAPATAEVVASLIHNRPYDLDLACCKPGRLSAKIAE